MRTCHPIAVMLVAITFAPLMARADAPSTQPSQDSSAVPATQAASFDPTDPDARALLEELRDYEARTGRRRIGYDIDGRIVSVLLTASSATEANMHALASFPDLTRIQISSRWDGTLSADALGELGKLPHLDRLELRNFGSEVTLDYAMALGKITSLKSLSITGSEIHAPAIQFLTALPNLTCLELRSCEDLTYADAAALAQLVKLEDLDLTYSGLTDESLDSLAQLPRLKELWVFSTRVTTEGVQHSNLYGKVWVRGARAKTVQKSS